MFGKKKPTATDKLRGFFDNDFKVAIAGSPEKLEEKKQKWKEFFTTPWKLAVCGAFVLLFAVSIFLLFTKSNDGPVNGRHADPNAVLKEQARGEQVVGHDLNVQPEQELASSQQVSSNQGSQTTNEEFRNMVVDGLGAAGLKFTEWIDLIVLLVVLGFIIGLFAKMGNMFR